MTRYYGDDYDMYSTVTSSVLRNIPALLTAGSVYAGLKRAYGDGYYYNAPSSKRIPLSDWVAPTGYTRVGRRDFGRYSRRFRLAGVKRYKVALKRKYLRELKKTFF